MSNISPGDIAAQAGNSALLSDQFVPTAKIENKRIFAIVDRINKLEESVTATASIDPSQTKPVEAFVSQPVVFSQGDFDTKETTWVNGAEDIYVNALTYYCYTEGPQRLCQNAPSVVWGPTSPGVLMVPTMFTTPVSVFMADRFYDNRASEFDFTWNFRVDNRAYNYLPNVGGNGGLIPRTVLGYPERGNILRFVRPLRIVASGSLTFVCAPTLRSQAVVSDVANGVVGNDNDRTVVNFVGLSYRTGSKLWPRR